MAHTHQQEEEHKHEHHHHGPVVLTHINRAFIIGIMLNFIFVIVEVIAGFSIHSLSLLSDAGHNLADVGTLALSLLAYRLVKVKANERYTYGYRKTSILVALFNAVVLLASIGAIIYEAIHRFLSPEPLPGTTIALGCRYRNCHQWLYRHLVFKRQRKRSQYQKRLPALAE